MIIKELTIKNFRSFGNNEQTLSINDEKGELILISGRNGSGKSSIFSCVEYVLYGRIQGKNKRISLQSIPNRMNRELLSSIKFKSEGTNIEIKRGINPNILELYENDILYDRAGKSNIEDRIQKWIGIDLDTFKSFLMLSIADFKNFISLSTEEKRLLLDKLFNLEAINILNNILKTVASENKKNIEILDREIYSFESSIQSIKNNLEKAKQIELTNISIQIDEIKTSIISKKEQWESLKDKKIKIEAKEIEINSKIEDDKREFVIISNEIKNCQKSIDLYNTGKCPMCQSILDGHDHLQIKKSFEDKKISLEELKEKFNLTIEEWNNRRIKLRKISADTNELYGDLTSTLRNLKFELDKLNQKNVENIDSESIKKIMESVTEIESKKINTIDKIEILKEKNLYHKELSKVFSEDGVKKVIIKNIINPINLFIDQNVKKINLPFQIVLDETFDAKIYSLGQEIDPETLSTGENKKTNIVILIAYLKLIRLKRNLNILFLDEVFASIDIESIDYILALLKDFANEYKINIFLVHHALLNSEHFNRILLIEKDIFTRIEELEVNN